jgi:hypothetical protein
MSTLLPVEVAYHENMEGPGDAGLGVQTTKVK